MTVPSNVVADETEAGDFGVGFHDAAEGALRVLGHGVGFVEDNDLVGRAGVGLPVCGDGLGAGCLAGEVLDLFSDDGDTSLVGCVEF